MMEELEYNCWIVIPDVLEGLFPWLMPPIREPIPAKKCAQRLEKKTFYVVSVYDTEEKKTKRIVVRMNECFEAELTVLVEAKNGEFRTMQKRLPAQSTGVWSSVCGMARTSAGS